MDNNTEMQEKDNSLANKSSSEQNSAKKSNKKVVKKATERLVSKSPMAASIKIAAAHVIAYLVFGLVAIIVTIGVAMFLVMSSSMVMEKFNNLSKAIGNAIGSWFGNDDTKNIENKQIYQVLDYIEKMGYALKEEGFLTEYLTEANVQGKDVKYDGDVITHESYKGKLEDYSVDESQGVIRDENGRIVGAVSEFVNQYLISDNYIYTIKNFNVVGNPWEAFWTHVGNLFAPSLKNKRGMIAIYHDNGLGIKGGLYESGELGYIKISPSTNKMVIKKGIFNNEMAYDLEGWTGRYGMPVEFLLAVHKATMMPDLAYDMVNTFETEVNILLHESNGSALATYIGPNGTVSYGELNTAVSGVDGNGLSVIWSWVDNLHLSDAEALAALNLGIGPDNHNNGCSCTDTTCDPACKDYIFKALHLMAAENDYHYSTYFPYIQKVQDHWFRDVYFVINTNGEDSRYFVTSDDDYEKVVAERWTKYQTFSKDEAIAAGNEDLTGRYKLFVMNKDTGEAGELCTDIDVYNGTINDEESTTKYIKKAVTADITDSDVRDDYKWNSLGDGIYSAYKPDVTTGTSLDKIFTPAQIESESDEQKKDIKNKLYMNMQISNITQEGDGLRAETNPEIKKMFLTNRYFRYTGTLDVAEQITQFRHEKGYDFGKIPDDADLNDSITYIAKDGTSETVKLKDVTGNVVINQDSLNAFSMLENTHTLDADYIYRDFKELVVELGFFTKEELSDTITRCIEFPVPEISSNGYPLRILDKNEHEKSTLMHSKNDFEAKYLSDFYVSSYARGDELPEEGGSKDATSGMGALSNPKTLVKTALKVLETDKVAISNQLQSISGQKKSILGNNGGPAITEDFINEDMADVDAVVRAKAEGFKYSTADQAYPKGNKEKYDAWVSSLGGVFSQLAGQETQGNGTGDAFIDAEKYVYGLMWIAGFEYCAGTCDEPAGDEASKGGSDRCDPIMDHWFEADANKYDAYNGTPGVHHSHVDLGPSDVRPFGECAPRHIDRAMVEQNFTTNCNHTTDKVYYKAGLFGESQKADPSKPDSSCDYKELIRKFGAKIIREPCDLHMGDFIECFDESSPYMSNNPDDWTGWSHVFFVGNEDENYLHLYTTGHDFTDTGDFVRVIPRDSTRDKVYHGGWIGLHIWDLKKTERYEGYKGNEAVVSPVTGILLEYGRYNDSDFEKSILPDSTEVKISEYRENVDLKYGTESTLLEGQIDEENNEVSSQRTTDTEEKEPVVDKVGYAKILVLDAKNYKTLEANSGTKWSSHSLVNITSNEPIYIDDLDKDKEVKDMSEKEKYVYAFKDFAETYQKCGISGFTIYMDGFVCELPDLEPKADESDPTQIAGDISTLIPHGEKLTFETFKSQSLSDSTLEKQKKDKDSLIKSKYEVEEKRKLSNKSETEKYKAELKVRDEAAYVANVNNKVFIKAGTVIGRTMTDKELIDSDIRKNDPHEYSYYRIKGSEDVEESGEINEYGEVEYHMDRVMGNYIRMFMYDTNFELVENIEDYMKLDIDESDPKTEIDSLTNDFPINEKVRIIMDYLMNEQGFTKEAAAGLVGNLMLESSLMGTADNGSHYGICQWDYTGNPTSNPSSGRWLRIYNYLMDNGFTYDHLGGQVKAIFESEDYTANQSAVDGMRSQTDARAAAKYWDDTYERSGGQALEARQRYAEQALEIYDGKRDSFS